MGSVFGCSHFRIRGAASVPEGEFGEKGFEGIPDVGRRDLRHLSVEVLVEPTEQGQGGDPVLHRRLKSVDLVEASSVRRRVSGEVTEGHRSGLENFFYISVGSEFLISNE